MTRPKRAIRKCGRIVASVWLTLSLLMTPGAGAASLARDAARFAGPLVSHANPIPGRLTAALALPVLLVLTSSERAWASASTMGDAWAWGHNNVGQLGIGLSGPGADRHTPVQVQGPAGLGSLRGVTAVEGGWVFILALREDGTVWAWGWNAVGQLGEGTTTASSLPVQVKGPGGVEYLTGVTAVAAFGDFSLALTSDGRVWGWGENRYGQLGATSGDTCNVAGTDYPCSKTPIEVSTLTAMDAIAGGRLHSLASGTDGQATTTCGYDKLYRLTSVTGSTGTTSYVYDPVGNRTTMTRGAPAGRRRHSERP